MIGMGMVVRMTSHGAQLESVVVVGIGVGATGGRGSGWPHVSARAHCIRVDTVRASRVDALSE
jgi:hypothetical protein